MEHWNNNQQSIEVGNSEKDASNKSDQQKFSFDQVLKFSYILKNTSNQPKAMITNRDTGEVRVKFGNPFFESQGIARGTVSVQDVWEYFFNGEESVNRKLEILQDFLINPKLKLPSSEEMVQEDVRDNESLEVEPVQYCYETEDEGTYEGYRSTSYNRMYKFIDILLDESGINKKFKNNLNKEQFEFLVYVLESWDGQRIGRMCSRKYERLDIKFISRALECFVEDKRKMRKLKCMWRGRIDGTDKSVYEERKKEKLKELKEAKRELVKWIEIYGETVPSLKTEKRHQLEMLDRVSSVFDRLRNEIKKEGENIKGKTLIGERIIEEKDQMIKDILKSINQENSD